MTTLLPPTGVPPHSVAYHWIEPPLPPVAERVMVPLSEAQKPDRLAVALVGAEGRPLTPVTETLVQVALTAPSLVRRARARYSCVPGMLTISGLPVPTNVPPQEEVYQSTSSPAPTVAERETGEPTQATLGVACTLVGAAGGGGAWIVKFTFEMSKKIWPIGSTRMRQAVALVVTVGSTTVWLPSLGVEARSVVGNVLPPSVERRMRTLAAEKGEALVPATSHVTVWVLPEGQLTAVLGLVTAKGVAVARTLTMMESERTPPPPARLSRTVHLRFMVRATAGYFSPATSTPFRTEGKRGNVREVAETGEKERKSGLAPLSAAVRAWAAPRSNCSHEYESVSPLASEEEAMVAVKGVPMGTLKSAPALMAGMELPVAVFEEQVAVLVTKVMTCSWLREWNMTSARFWRLSAPQMPV